MTDIQILVVAGSGKKTMINPAGRIKPLFREWQDIRMTGED